jgi:hypothetical protein
MTRRRLGIFRRVRETVPAMDVLLSVDAGPGAEAAEREALAVRLRDELAEHELDADVPAVDGDRVELTGATDEERRRALEVWLAKHEQRGG